jgi:hypothetical protein
MEAARIEPRRQSTSEESPEDPDLATPDAARLASEQGHKQAAEPEELPFIHPGQLTMFDLLGDG